MLESREDSRTSADATGDAAVDSARPGSQESPAGGRTRPLHPLAELTLTRLREFLREPEAVFWVFGFPILLAFALGIAFRNTGPEKIHVAVETGGAQSSVADALADTLRRTPDLEVLALAPEEARQALRSGKVALVVRPDDSTTNVATTNAPNADASEATARGALPEGSRASYEYRFDPTRPESRAARLVVDDTLQRAAGRGDVARSAEVKITEPGARYIDFLIPGLLGLNLMGSGLWGVGFGIVTARMRKLLKRLSATPMRRSHYLASFVLSRMVFLTLEVSCVLVFVWLVFGYDVRGSLASMSVLLVVGAFTFSGLGLLVSSRAETIEGVSGLMNLVMIPMWLFSGTFFSSERFPAFFQPFIKALPLTALNDSLRSVMNEGAPLAANWSALGVLVAWCVLSFVVALKLFRWQ
ncbi:MAG TPA: ABC transporter permease [Pyrinomonadaceae bacterium]|nr:ABC transporter permease [Pyrinomonadaceae bacterium]